MRCEPEKLDELLHPVFDTKALAQAKALSQGLPASPGAATGQVVFFAEMQKHGLLKVKNYPLSCRNISKTLRYVCC